MKTMLEKAKAAKTKVGCLTTEEKNEALLAMAKALEAEQDKILAAIFETAGQFTYVYALSGNGAIAAPIISSVCIVSLLLSRIFLKEKLSWKTYVFIAIVIFGILLLAVSEEL